MDQDNEQCCRRSLVQSLWDSVKKVGKDPIPIPTDAAKERLEICGKCNRFDGSKCRECGCYMSLKVNFAEVSCPIGKWGKYERE